MKLLVLFYCVGYAITAYEARAAELKCNTLCNNQVDRRVCLKNCMSSIKNRIDYHGGEKLSNRARKSILTLKKKRRHRHKKQDIFKRKTPVKGRKIIRNYKKKLQ